MVVLLLQWMVWYHSEQISTSCWQHYPGICPLSLYVSKWSVIIYRYWPRSNEDWCMDQQSMQMKKDMMTFIPIATVSLFLDYSMFTMCRLLTTGWICLLWGVYNGLWIHHSHILRVLWDFGANIESIMFDIYLINSKYNKTSANKLDKISLLIHIS